MSPFLLFLLLDLPVMNGPVTPSEFPIAYSTRGEESAAYDKLYTWIGTDTLLVRSGIPPAVSYRLEFDKGCPVRELRYEAPDSVDRIRQMTCSGGRVSGWAGSNGRDSAVYLYHGGLLDSMARFYKPSALKPFRLDHSMKTTYDAEGRPLVRRDWIFEDEGSGATDSLVNTYSYHLPDSVAMSTAPDASGESRVTVFRLKDGNLMSMAETVSQDGKTYVYNHYWSYGGTAALRRSGSGRSPGTGMADRSEAAAVRFPGNGIWWRPDGRRDPVPRP
jgi:hypothetical protein